MPCPSGRHNFLYLSWTQIVGRSAARNTVSWTFDDDFDLGTDALQLGAGPNMVFTGPGDALNSRQTIDQEAEHVYKPFLARFTEYANGIKLGNGLEKATTMGPLANARRLDAMDAFVSHGVR